MGRRLHRLVSALGGNRVEEAAACARALTAIVGRMPTMELLPGGASAVTRAVLTARVMAAQDPVPWPAAVMRQLDPDDPAFGDSTKPIGYFYDGPEGEALARELGWEMKEDSGRGWRHVVPSPKPKHIVDISLIRALAEHGAVVIAGGGGGIPVRREPNGVRHGVEAVIDKDLTSAHMARILGIEEIMILTAVSHVAVHFGTPEQKELDQISLSEMRTYYEQGHFPPGSMGPKIEAAIGFLEAGGKRVVIGHLDEALPALRGETGTQILPDDP